MSRFLAFDDVTAEAIREKGAQVEAATNADMANAISDAVQQQRTVVVVVPAGPERATVARITPPQRLAGDSQAE